MPLWYGVYGGWLSLTPALPAFAWHAHEMVFGFAPAVIGGFLLTAVRAWTGRGTPSGLSLAALLALWLAGRILLITGPAPLAVVVDVAFLPVLAACLAVPLWQARNRRNAFVVPLLLAMAALALVHHGAHGGWLPGAWAPRSQTVAMDLVALLLAVIGGRIIPAFSANAVPGLHPQRWPAVEALAIGLLGVVIVLDLTGWARYLPMEVLRLGLAGTGLVHLVRLLGWKPWATRDQVLLAALPLGYLWLPVHLLLRAWLDVTPGVMSPLALHALSVGAMAGLMLAMMTRSTLGHTGRPLSAGAAETFMFTAIHVAALCRVAAPVWWPGAYTLWLGVSTLAWMLAFGAFAIVYAPIVTRPRVDQPPAR